MHTLRMSAGSKSTAIWSSYIILVLAQTVFGTIGFISRLGLAAIFINIIAGGLSGHFFILIAIFRLCQICGAKISDKIDSAVRVWVKFY